MSEAELRGLGTMAIIVMAKAILPGYTAGDDRLLDVFLNDASYITSFSNYRSGKEMCPSTCKLKRTV